MSADLKGAVLRKLGDEPRWAGLRFRRELPLWLTEISAVPAYNPNLCFKTGLLAWVAGRDFLLRCLPGMLAIGIGIAIGMGWVGYA